MEIQRQAEKMYVSREDVQVFYIMHLFKISLIQQM